MTYTELNAALVEHFGDLERLCNQSYNEHHGVTSYIEDMKANDYRGVRYVPGWTNTLSRLKDVRHKRNQLSHGEVSFSDSWATPEDINFVYYFRQNILNGTDPLSVLRKQSQAVDSNNREQPNVTPYAPSSRQPLSCMGVIALFAIALAILLCFLM